MSTDVLALAQSLQIIPVVEIEDASRAVQLARTLTDAGLPMMEVTMRTSAALPTIEAIARALPDFAVGAGTVLSPANMRAAAAAGARFAVSPGFTPTLSKVASDLALPFVPGAATPTEVLAAAELGHRFLKFFPAEQLGGAPVLKAFSSPFAPLGITFMPTGGVRSATLRDYLDLPNVTAVGGTWIAQRDVIAAGDFDRIGEAASRAVAALH